MRSTKNSMSKDKGAKLIGLFFLGFVLLTFPILNLFGRELFLGGIPLLYLYVFGVWLIMIIIVSQILKW